MKVKIIRGFVDSETGCFMGPGMTAEYKAERAKKLAEDGLVEIDEKKAVKGK